MNIYLQTKFYLQTSCKSFAWLRNYFSGLVDFGPNSLSARAQLNIHSILRSLLISYIWSYQFPICYLVSSYLLFAYVTPSSVRIYHRIALYSIVWYHFTVGLGLIWINPPLFYLWINDDIYRALPILALPFLSWSYFLFLCIILHKL